MSVSQVLKPHLPSLRRFARALSGSQESGDAYVVALLEAILENAAMFPPGLPPKIALYRLFLKNPGIRWTPMPSEFRHQGERRVAQPADAHAQTAAGVSAANARRVQASGNRVGPGVQR